MKRDRQIKKIERDRQIDRWIDRKISRKIDSQTKR